MHALTAVLCGPQHKGQPPHCPPPDGVPRRRVGVGGAGRRTVICLSKALHLTQGLLKCKKNILLRCLILETFSFFRGF